MQIDVNLLSGPFRSLHNRWRFEAAPGGTEVEFDIDFDFKSRLLETLLAANVHLAVDQDHGLLRGAGEGALRPAERGPGRLGLRHELVDPVAEVDQVGEQALQGEDQAEHPRRVVEIQRPGELGRAEGLDLALERLVRGDQLGVVDRPGRRHGLGARAR